MYMLGFRYENEMKSRVQSFGRVTFFLRRTRTKFNENAAETGLSNIRVGWPIWAISMPLAALTSIQQFFVQSPENYPTT